MKISRKQALKTMAAGTLATVSAPAFSAALDNLAPLTLAGNVNHSVCRWCYQNIPLEQLCEAAKGMGLKSVELLGPNEWPVAIKYGLTCAMSNGSSLGIPRGFNDPTYHEQLLKDFSDVIPKAADHGIKNVICFSGNRNGMDDATGLENCARGLEPVVKLAQKYNINIVMELLNSKVNHPDYMCDHTPWGVALCEKVGSENFKLLYDIYHMQIMEGDIIATIDKHHKYIAHYHTGGVPGRAEIDETQELYYPAIMRAILKTGFKGFVAQEFIPKGGDPLASLKAGVKICDV
ncbi:MAG: TIM barrel protein [Cyclobacteriaceae bacterium]|jgi:hydroxypyruvate isomerase|nr:TIM barrel protein [Cyclobacteriaceae bacterium]